MLSLYTLALMRDALTQPLDPKLHGLLTDRIANTCACELEDLTHVLVIQAGDTESAITEEIGFSPLVHRIDGTPTPDWDWAEAHDGWWELIYTVGDSGFAYVLFVQDVDGVLPALRTLCRANIT